MRTVIGIALLLVLQPQPRRAITVLVFPVEAGPSSCPEIAGDAATVRFDVDGDGKPEQVHWPVAGDKYAFLALDRNNNGIIDNAAELIGSETRTDTRDPWVALDREWGQNKPAIEAGDALYSRLLLWSDRNRNGRSELGEQRPVSDIAARIGLGYRGPGPHEPSRSPCRFEGWMIRSEDYSGSPSPRDRVSKFYSVTLPIQR